MDGLYQPWYPPHHHLLVRTIAKTSPQAITHFNFFLTTFTYLAFIYGNTTESHQQSLQGHITKLSKTGNTSLERYHCNFELPEKSLVPLAEV